MNATNNATNKRLRIDDSDISAGQRPIRDGKAFDSFFPPATVRHLDRVEKKDGDVQDTLRFMERVVHTWKEDTHKLADFLRRDTTEATLEAIWSFLYNNIQYKLDRAGLEELRRPSRSWADRKNGIDCDDFAMFASSLLVNLQIPHKLRVARYTQDTWQHVYVVIPKGEDSIGEYWTVDAVLSRFDYEKPFTDKMDYPMSLTGINIAVLSGIETAAPVPDEVRDHRLGSLAEAVDIIAGIDDDNLSGTDDEQKMYDFLRAMRTLVAADNGTMSAVTGEDKAGLLKALDYALTHWFTSLRLPALGALAEAEQRYNVNIGYGHLNGFLGSLEEELHGADDDNILSGLMGLDGVEGLQRAKAAQSLGSIKKFFSKVSSAVKKTAQKVGGAVKKVAQKSWQVIKKINPVTVAMRNGLLLALKLNFAHMAERLKWAFATPEQAAKHKTDPAVIARAKAAMAKTENIFTKLGGNKDNLRKAILSAKKGKLDGLGQLGDPISLSAIAAAMPVIMKIIGVLKESGLFMPSDNNVEQTGMMQEDAASEAGITTGGYTPSLSQYTPAAQTAMPTEYRLPPTYVPQGYAAPQPMQQYPTYAPQYDASAYGGGELEGIGDGLQFVRDNAKVIAIGAVAIGAAVMLSKNNSSSGTTRRKSSGMAGVGRKSAHARAKTHNKAKGHVQKMIIG